MIINDHKLNMMAMDILSEMRPGNNIESILLDEVETDSAKVQAVAINRAIDALHMQNKILEHIDKLADKSCFMTDNEGVITLLKGLIVGNEENM